MWSADPPSPSNPLTTNDSNALLHFMSDFSLSQSVFEITRPSSGKTLDLVFSSKPSLVSNTHIAPGMSDHDIVLFDINTKVKFSTKPPYKIYLYKSMDLDGLGLSAKNLSESFFNSSPISRSVDENWILFKDALLNAIDVHIPCKFTKSKLHLPWITRSIKKDMNKRDKLLKRANLYKDKESWDLYKKQRNKVVNTLKSSHNNYLHDTITANLENNPKRFWNYVKLCRTENIDIPPLQSDKSIFISDTAKADALSDHFKSMFTQPDGIIPDKTSSQFPAIANITFGVEGIRKILSDLNPNKAEGPDHLPARVLKEVAEEISGILTFIFQQSYDSACVPKDWSEALVTPIFKKGVKSDPVNYRPISLTCLCSKIMEHVVLSHLNKHLARHNILCENQHGFRRNFSCSTQLVSTVHDWASALNTHCQVDALLLDFSKAFDKVSHHKLLVKLKCYGIDGSTLNWIKSFLDHRTQTVSVNGSHSQPVDVTSGVPQGSVLGPTLFLLYINDITDGIKSDIRLFADDTIVYRTIKSDEDHYILQQDLETLSQWCKTWSMQFNEVKCNLLTITNKKKPSKFVYCINNKILIQVSSHDYLGVKKSHDLHWNLHCTKVSSSANKVLGIIRRTLRPCSQLAKKRAYEALVRPKLEYACEAWNPHTDTDVQLIERVQKNAARFVCNNYDRCIDSSELALQLGWDTLEQRRLIRQLTLFFKLSKGLLGISLPPDIISRQLSNLKFLQPQCSVLSYSYSFYVRSIRVWNRLPNSIRNSTSLPVFQSAIGPAINTLNHPTYLKRF